MPLPPDQVKRYKDLRDAVKNYASLVVALTPESEQQKLAINSIHIASMMANAAIAVNEPGG